LQELGLAGVAALDGAHEIFKALGVQKELLDKLKSHTELEHARPGAGMALK